MTTPPPPLPRDTLAQLQLASHLHTLTILFRALAGFHALAAVMFVLFACAVGLAPTPGASSSAPLAAIYAAIAVLALVLAVVQWRTATHLGHRTALANCQRAAWLAIFAGPLGMALTAYALAILRRPDAAGLFDRGDRVGV